MGIKVITVKLEWDYYLFSRTAGGTNTVESTVSVPDTHTKFIRHCPTLYSNIGVPFAIVHRFFFKDYLLQNSMNGISTKRKSAFFFSPDFFFFHVNFKILIHTVLQTMK